MTKLGLRDDELKVLTIPSFYKHYSNYLLFGIIFYNKIKFGFFRILFFVYFHYQRIFNNIIDIWINFKIKLCS